ncbi:MAG: molybdenum cofactor biosynthesis protein [Dehalococcoidia bacterium]|nr:molybdenum cofactor biosynthesis protein [Dehalococcoidia bacterium]MQG16287.1 MogA/MoaB family molybdenum cofactor biosynthesis protein [SAR202 cluster bacterium]|tara:strand:+ start:11587 stop:12084 length:498 start_codon:yes stop_codon:yes gene_type:complete
MSTNHNYKFGVLTISDSGHSGSRKDVSGDLAVKVMISLGYKPVYRDIVPDQIDLISSKLIEWADSGEVDAIITTGGTGVSPRDRTPEATKLVIDYEIPGIPEAIRIVTREFTEMSMLTRGLAGIRSKCLIVNLPGSPKGVEQGLEVISQVMRHAIALCQDTDQMH